MFSCCVRKKFAIFGIQAVLAIDMIIRRKFCVITIEPNIPEICFAIVRVIGAARVAYIFCVVFTPECIN
jgi:hypothetical protein